VNAAVVIVFVAGGLACEARDRESPVHGVAPPATTSPAADPGVEARPAATQTPTQTQTTTPTPTRSPAYAGIAHRPPVAVLTALGRSAFFDRTLSASGALACADCHDPGHGLAPARARAIQRGGADGQQLGFRAAPGLRYLTTIPRFTEHAIEAETGVDGGPTGGLLWDGRAATMHDQARLPLFASFEMANGSAAELAGKLRGAAYACALRDAFGDAVIDRDESAVDAVALALEVFEQSPAEFYPYDSKLDAVIRGQATLSAREARGFALFNAPDKGNCASCHPSKRPEGGAPAFTDFGFAALGVPRARPGDVPANRDPAFFDLGLCGPLRRDLAARAEYCGMFRTPSLRNVAVRRRLFHNGSFTSLTDVVRFYVTRDVAPERWYPRDRAGRVIKFDDLPAAARVNVNQEPPFGGKPGDKPALDDGEIADVVAFLATLTDGYRPEPTPAPR
jgi:cytochrome c peroxidase